MAEELDEELKQFLKEHEDEAVYDASIKRVRFPQHPNPWLYFIFLYYGCQCTHICVLVLFGS